MKFLNRCMFLTLAASCLAGNQYATAQMTAEPTEQHKILQEDVGTWDCAMKIWAQGPEAEPMQAKGTEVNEMLGKFWLVSVFKGDMMGQPFEGRASIGYDSTKKKYVGTWFDSMNPNMSFMEGTYDQASKTMTMMTHQTGLDGKQILGKNVSVARDDGSRVFTMFMQTPESGEMVKMFEITYTKRK